MVLCGVGMFCRIGVVVVEAGNLYAGFDSPATPSLSTFLRVVVFLFWLVLECVDMFVGQRQ